MATGELKKITKSVRDGGLKAPQLMEGIFREIIIRLRKQKNILPLQQCFNETVGQCVSTRTNEIVLFLSFSNDIR